MSDREQKPKEDDQAERDETVEDLEAPEDQAGEVTGGLSDWYKRDNE